jgi:beta-lactam-binding protein with PASTA domain
VTQRCLANPFTPPQDVDTVRFVAGSEPDLEVCTQPTSYQVLVVPSVIGLAEEAAIGALGAAGFNVAVEHAISDQPEDTVIDQEPRGGSSLIQTGTVTITVARGDPEPQTAEVPNVIGLRAGPASSILRNSGFEVSIVPEQECDPVDPKCVYTPGVVWQQSPSGGQAEIGSTVMIVVNP